MARLPHLAVFATALLLAGCQLTPAVGVTPRYGWLEIDGDVFASSSSSSGSTSADSLGLDDDDPILPRVDVDWGPLALTASGFLAEYSGEGTAEGQFDLDGNMIAAGDDVATDLDLGTATVLLTYDVAPTDLVEVGLGLGLVAVEVDATIESLNTGERIDTDQIAGLPVVAARAGVEVGRFWGEALASGLVFEYGDVEAAFLDLDVHLGVKLVKTGRVYGALVGGYRYMILDVEYDDGSSVVEADLDLSGPYLGLTLGF